MAEHQASRSAYSLRQKKAGSAGFFDLSSACRLADP